MLRLLLLCVLVGVSITVPVKDNNSKVLQPTDDTLLHQLGDYFKGRSFRRDGAPYPTADSGILHQIGDYFKGRSIQRDARVHIPFHARPGKGHHGLSPMHALHQEEVTKFVNLLGDHAEEPGLLQGLRNDILHALGDYFKGR